MMAFNVVYILLFLVIFLGLIVTALVFLGLWVKNDAAERGMDNPVIWALVVALVPNLLGLIIYLVVRTNHGRTLPCVQCGYPIKDAASFCSRCGTQQPVETQTAAPVPVNDKHYLRKFVICFVSAFAAMFALIIAAMLLSL